jgi:hypothetical protein
MMSLLSELAPNGLIDSDGGDHRYVVHGPDMAGSSQVIIRK